MPPRLLIDGYNFIYRMSPGSLDMDTSRSHFLEALARYGRERGVKVTVVFDAPGSLSPNRLRQNHRGVEVIYSGRGETADDVIIEVLRKKQAGFILVSSDRALIDEAKKNGIAFVTPDRMAEALHDKAEREEEMPVERKGNPRRLPKRVRRAKKTIGKI